MTETSFPWDSSNTFEDGWRDMSFGMWRHFGIIAGKENLLLVTGNSDGMQVHVATGRAVLRGQYYRNDADKTVSIAAAHPTLSRRDLIVLRSNYAANTITAVAKSGTPGSTALPVLTQNDSDTWEEPIGIATVGAAVTTMNPGNVLPVYKFANAMGADPPGVQLDYTGTAASVKLPFIPADGTVYVADQLPTLLAVFPAYNPGGGVNWGFASAFNTIVVPDARGLVSAGVDGAAARIPGAAADTLGAFLGRADLIDADLPEHAHMLKLHNDGRLHLIYSWSGGGAFHVPAGAGVVGDQRVDHDTLDNIYANVPVTASTELWPATTGDPIARVQPTQIVNKIIKV